MENLAKKQLGKEIGRGRSGYKKEDTNNKKVRLNVWMDSSKYFELKELASYEDKTVSEIIRELVDKLLIVD